MPKAGEEIGVKAAAYLGLKEQEKKIVAEQKKLRQELEEHVEQHGQKSAKGHIISVVPHAGRQFEIKKELRVSSYMEPNAKDILEKELDAKVKKKVLEQVVVIREDVLEHLVETGEISEEVVTKIYGSSESYAFKVSRV